MVHMSVLHYVRMFVNGGKAVVRARHVFFTVRQHSVVRADVFSDMLLSHRNWYAVSYGEPSYKRVANLQSGRCGFDFWLVLTAA